MKIMLEILSRKKTYVKKIISKLNLLKKKYLVHQKYYLTNIIIDLTKNLKNI